MLPPRKSSSRVSLRAALGAILLVTSVILAGCSGALVSTPLTPAAVAVSGNWQIASSAASASRLPALSGSLSGSSTAITGLFHSDSLAACIPPSQIIELSGSANAKQFVTLVGTKVAGGTLTITGTLAADGKSLSSAIYTVTGGTCAFAAPASASAQAYASIDGNYTGSFTDSSGNTIAVTATLTQSPSSDTDGNFQLSGTGAFPSNPCLSSPASISNSQVSGGSFNLIYTDATSGNTVNTSGTFSADGKTHTVTQWTLAGACGPDTGTGSLSRP